MENTSRATKITPTQFVPPLLKIELTLTQAKYSYVDTWASNDLIFKLNVVYLF